MVSGVPQVTVLSPLLFLLHINDLPSVVFADDCLIYINIKNKEDQIALQKDLNLLENWGNTWGMRFNAAKCNIMRVSRIRDPKLFNYSLTGQVLEEVMDSKYLGVTLSNDLEWSKHIAVELQVFFKSRYSRYSSVSDMLDVLGWTPLSQSRQEARLILFYKIINGLAQVPFDGVLVEAYKGTRRKHNMKFRQIGHTTSQYGQSFFS